MIKEALYTIIYSNPDGKMEAHCKVDTDKCEIINIESFEKGREDEPDVEFIFLDNRYYRIVHVENKKMFYEEP